MHVLIIIVVAILIVFGIITGVYFLSNLFRLGWFH